MRILLILSLILVALAVLLIVLFYGIGSLTHVNITHVKQPAQTELFSKTQALDTHITRLQVDGIMNLNLKQGNTPTLVITSDKYGLAHIETTQDGDTLRLLMDTPNSIIFNRDTRVQQHVQTRVDITLPALTELRSDGIGNYTINGFHGDTMRLYQDGVTRIQFSAEYRNMIIEQSGAGNIDLDAKNGDTVDISQSGIGHINIRGAGRLLKAELSGVGRLDAQLWQADRAEIELSGVGNASVYARSSVKASLSGVGSLNMYGNPPQRDVEKDGVGSIYWK